ncbi:MAG: aryl-sulfate sulfotransferase [Anaerolineales bacterium]|nr:aryl-sulfate sulfotransferase [Anaerolineales bacterium]MCB8950824.1 aryl-sulfate sulfotransferase [Ardenticatenales bacterium]
MRKMFFVLLVCMLFVVPVAFAGEGAAATPDTVVTITPNLPTGQLLGTPIQFTISVDDADPYLYRFSAGRQGEAMHIIYDYTPDNVLTWTPIEDGLFVVQASAKNRNTGQISTTSITYLIRPRAPLSPVVSFSTNNLVALYSAPKCPAGYKMRVVFIEFQTTRPSSTDKKPCDGAHTMNFYIGGMHEGGLYFMLHQVYNPQGNPVATGPVKYFIAGTVPLIKPFAYPYVAPGPQTSYAEILVLLSPINGTDTTPAYPHARDLGGRMVWYYDHNVNQTQFMRPVPGGTFLIRADRPDVQGQIMREVDLAGNVVRETTVEAVDAQIKAMGFTDDFTTFHHEARLMENGYYVMLGNNERILVDVQGPGPVDVIGDYIVVLDHEWQVVWAWNAFDHLDPARLAILDEHCVSQGPGCPPLFLDVIANDWTHANSVAYTPDGNLLLSMRHQDWVVKLNYANGAGDGSVIWRLGPDGDFTLNDPDPNAWLTHQHDANYVAGNQIALFDNGNTRCAADPELCYSRGQVYQIDEVNMTASLVLNADLGNYSFALGSAEKLSNGNYHFNSGIQPVGTYLISTAQEVSPDGTTNYSLLLELGAYRSFRMVNMYSKPGSPPITDLINPLDYVNPAD